MITFQVPPNLVTPEDPSQKTDYAIFSYTFDANSGNQQGLTPTTPFISLPDHPQQRVPPLTSSFSISLPPGYYLGFFLTKKGATFSPLIPMQVISQHSNNCTLLGLYQIQATDFKAYPFQVT